MSNETPRTGTRHIAANRDWSARVVIESGPPKRFTLVIEQKTDGNPEVITIQLTGAQGRAVLRVLQNALLDAGELIGEAPRFWRSGEQPDGSWTLDCRPRPIYDGGEDDA
jgi:hypothetical protein